MTSLENQSYALNLNYTIFRRQPLLLPNKLKISPKRVRNPERCERTTQAMIVHLQFAFRLKSIKYYTVLQLTTVHLSECTKIMYSEPNECMQVSRKQKKQLKQRNS